ncbi:hypothetical protein PHLCEN_2v553 [Hermanssonia centrifuga]|uniref:ATP-dependent DNA helicase n=1 Tax=Hermanssonia centrifuga TaxID=98765 RepID=A0A2R6S5T0_9APHY|nr:hypothetical protein PHLCEN_2v553 [Hermanssonia centrifuga]
MPEMLDAAVLDTAGVSLLTIDELRSFIRTKLSVPHSHSQRKAALVEWVVEHASSAGIAEDIQRAVNAKLVAIVDRPPKRKRAQAAQNSSRKASRTEMIEELTTHDVEKFLDLPSEGRIWECYSQFYEATSNAATKHVICGVCAQEVSVEEEGITELTLDNIPHSHRLRPTTSHNEQTLYTGLLLQPDGINHGDEGHYTVNVCRECLSDLSKREPDLPPKFSLANDLWIGPIPHVLATMTLPEQMLIALVYPRVFVYKLYPKHLQFRPDAATLQRGMRGTVSSYDLDMEGASSMIQGNLMPRPLSVLATVVSITFMGKGQMPKSWLHHTFRVRRRVVLRALLWLKTNNPKYYGEITIDMARLNILPEDDVPIEITGVARQTEDEEVILAEHTGYVPDAMFDPVQDNDDPAEYSRSDLLATPDEQGVETDTLDEGQGGSDPPHASDNDPEVVLLQITGTVDTDMSRLSSNEMMLFALSNLWSQGQEGGYEIRHARMPTNDFPPRGSANDAYAVANLYEKAFPCLFPYGRGGLEAPRPVEVKLRDHIRWALRYVDRRFRKHETFPFLTFGILQRREALESARLQMSRRDFERDGQLMSAITLAQFETARGEEEKGLPISDPALRALRKHVHAALGRVMGSDQSRYKLRSRIRSTSVLKGPPSLWTTWNPHDHEEPLVQAMAGHNINLDDFVSTMGPNSEERMRTVAEDPYAAAKFFHFIIRTLLQCLCQVTVTQHQVKSQIGIFGEVSAYFGTVESQGRGTLHLHMLIWLKNAPSTAEMVELLKDEAFRAKVCAFIKANIRAYLPGLEDEQSVKAFPKTKNVAYCRPPKPGSDDYETQLQELEKKLARAEQVHTCKPIRCLRLDKRGNMYCKRKAPFQLALEDFVTEAGTWGPKRLFPFMNAYCPHIIVNMRCNNDIKLLTNGSETKNISFYITSYTTKKQSHHYNTSALLADGYAYHKRYPNEKYLDDLRQSNRLMLFRLVNTVNREQELAAVMVISYLMRWGDTQPAATAETAESEVEQLIAVPVVEATTSDATDHLAGEGLEDPTGESVADLVTLDVGGSGVMFEKSQVTDYRCRGQSLQDHNVLNLFVDTYEERIPKVLRHRAATDDAPAGGRGRQAHSRYPYLDTHPKFRQVRRVARSQFHRNLPDFVGPWPARSDDAENDEFYCASMLVLLKPWRNMKTDLKNASETWRQAFDRFLASKSPEALLSTQRILSGLQYHHECDSAARADRATQNLEGADEVVRNHARHEDGTESLDMEDEDVSMEEAQTEAHLQHLLSIPANEKEHLHAVAAVSIAKHHGIFTRGLSGWEVLSSAVSTAVGDDVARLQRWQKQLGKDKARLNGEVETVASDGSAAIDSDATVACASASQAKATPGQVSVISAASESSLEVDASMLKADQYRAFDIITWHLEQSLAGAEPPPLRMILYGEGGTGKSKVIQTVTEVFNARGAAHMLVKAAYTGVAASLINGKTTHNIAAMPTTKKVDSKLSDSAKTRLQAFWSKVTYLIIDEYSMLSKSFLAILSRNITIGKTGSPTFRAGHSFGGVNVILCGDLHQFPPVVSAHEEYLFYENSLRRDVDPKSHTRAAGRVIYEEFKTVVVLKEQMRVTDHVWRDVLVHLRQGEMQAKHIKILRSLVLGQGGGAGGTDFERAPWSEASLVTPRHAVRRMWNSEAARKACKAVGQRLLLCAAEDTVAGRATTLAERYELVDRGKSDNQQQKNDLPRSIEIAIGMQVLVTDNIETDLDLTNGARGQIVNIILHPDEPPMGDEAIVQLKYLPLYLLVKMTRTRASRLEGLEEGVVPVEPKQTTMRIVFKKGPLKGKSRTIRRRQFPVTPAYAFTDYRAQGQTIPFVVVDIASPPYGKLSLFNLYVALSRSSGRETIRLLRDFDDRLFCQRQDTELYVEDERLERLNGETLAWWSLLGQRREG